jgi:exodeoxyribonuclease V alpha subunit
MISLTTSPLLSVLEFYHQQGLIRAVDLEFAAYIYQKESQARQLNEEGLETLALYACLLSYYLGQGHVCIDLEKLGATNNPFGFDVEQTALLSPELILATQPLNDLLVLEQAAAVRCSKLDSSGQVPPLSGAGFLPMTLDERRLYLSRYFNLETRVATYLNQNDSQLTLDLPLMADVLSNVFPEVEQSTETPGVQTFDHQKLAAAVSVSNAVSVITGGPGTGKTYTLVRLLICLIRYADAAGLATPKIALAAPTGKAAARMLESVRAALDEASEDFIPEHHKQLFPTAATTLHRLLGSIPGRIDFRHNKANPLHLDILIIDEASMIDMPMMTRLLDAMPKHGRLVLLGDKDQLASVEAGAVLSDLCQDYAENAANSSDGFGYSPAKQQVLWSLLGLNKSSELTAGQLSVTKTPSMRDKVAWLRVSRRFHSQSGIGQFANLINLQQTDQLSQFLAAAKVQYPDDLELIALSEASYSAFLDDIAGEYRGYLRSAERANYEEALQAFAKVRLLCALREGDFGVTGLNTQIEQRLFADKVTQSQVSSWYIGRPVMITQNDHAVGLYNGDIGICMRSEDERLRVYFEDSEGVRGVLPSRLPPHQTAFAMTVHKSQGSEFEHTYFMVGDRYSPVLTKELVYTAVTRAKQRFSMLYQPDTLAQAINASVTRFSGLADRIKGVG